MSSDLSSQLLAYDRAGPRGGRPLLLLHAGVADRRMWDGVWSALTCDRDVVRVDLRGFGESDRRPGAPLDPVRDVAQLLDALDIDALDVVGASFGAGVSVELALVRPELVTSLLLAAPGGSLLSERTDDFAAFAAAESAALSAGDLDAAVAANVEWWVVGPGRPSADVATGVRAAVAVMQRRAFEIAAVWEAAGPPDGIALEPVALEPPALERLGEIAVPTTVLIGRFDLETVRSAAAAVAARIPAARLVRWDDVAHLPAMEQPQRFVQLVRDGATAAT